MTKSSIKSRRKYGDMKDQKISYLKSEEIIIINKIPFLD